MPLPKRRHSPSRQNKRRAHDALPQIVYAHCSRCNEPIQPHRVCSACGYYKGEAVLKVKEKKKKKNKGA